MSALEVTSYVPGRMRMRIAGATPGLIASMAEHICASTDDIRAQAIPSARSVVLEFPRERRRADLLAAAREALDAAYADPPAARRRLAQSVPRLTWQSQAMRRARSLVAGRVLGHGAPHRVRGHAARVALSTAAVAAAAAEALPFAVIALGIAAAAAPTLHRALFGVRRGRLTMDDLDVANVGLLIWAGDLLSAGQITWIISMGNLISATRLRHVGGRIEDLVLVEWLGKGGQAQRIIEMIKSAPVNNARIEHRITKSGDRLLGPILLGSAATLLLTADPVRAVETLKAADIASSLKSAAPTTVMSAMVAGVIHGYVIHGGRAMEKLAAADTIIVQSPEAVGDPEALRSTAIELIRAGIREVVVPAEAMGRGSGGRGSRNGSGIRVLPGAAISGEIARLREAGRRLGVVCYGAHAFADCQHTELRIMVAATEDTPLEHAEVFLFRGGLASLARARAGADEAVSILQQNLRVVAIPTTLGLFASVFGYGTPLITTALHHGASALAGLNGLRPLLRHRQK